MGLLRLLNAMLKALPGESVGSFADVGILTKLRWQYFGVSYATPYARIQFTRVEDRYSSIGELNGFAHAYSGNFIHFTVLPDNGNRFDFPKIYVVWE
jgi:hypothetical protein